MLPLLGLFLWAIVGTLLYFARAAWPLLLSLVLLASVYVFLPSLLLKRRVRR